MAIHQCSPIRRRKITGAEDGVGAFQGKRHQQSRNIAGVIFKIGIVNDANFTRGVLQSSADCHTFAGIALVPEQKYAIVVRREAL